MRSMNSLLIGALVVVGIVAVIQNYAFKSVPAPQSMYESIMNEDAAADADLSEVKSQLRTAFLQSDDHMSDLGDIMGEDVPVAEAGSIYEMTQEEVYDRVAERRSQADELIGGESEEVLEAATEEVTATTQNIAETLTRYQDEAGL